jgi:hypothetical protein
MNRAADLPAVHSPDGHRLSRRITHRARLENGPALYETFRDKTDGCIKVVMTPRLQLCRQGGVPVDRRNDNMPQFYLHIRDGEQLMKDEEGIELPSIGSAKSEAEDASREILASKVRAGEIIDGQQFEIHDAWGNRMLTMLFRSVLRLT